MGRAPCCEKMGLKKGPWTPEEDQILISYIHQHGHSNWRALPKQAGLLRCGKSCRLRWINYLRPDIKRGNFTPEEEETIIKLHQMLGNRWSAIAARLPGRTDNEIKNVWHTHLKKRLPKSDFDSAITTTTTNIDGPAAKPTKKRARKSMTTKNNNVLTKSKSEHVNCMDFEDNNDNSYGSCENDDKISSINGNSTVGTRPGNGKTRGPVSPQPSSSEVSALTSASTTSSSTSENDNRDQENEGSKGEYFGDLTEIDDDFWMEVLSLEDTAISTQDLPCISQYDQKSSLDPSMTELRFESSSKVDGDDMDIFWSNLLSKSNDSSELLEML